jgi:hypothetical protein
VSAPGSVALRRMSAGELGRIGEIDRSEHVTHQYEYRQGMLASRPVYVAVPSWTVEFYLGRGFQPTDQPDAALFALEPEDIHMLLEL